MDFEMQLRNQDLKSCFPQKKLKKRDRKNKALCDSNNTNHEGASLMLDVLLQKDSCVESTTNICSNSGLIEVQSNSYINCSENKKKRKKEKKKRRKALKAVNMDVGLQEDASETKTTPIRIEAPVDVSINPVSEKDSCVEPTANISSNPGLIELQSNSTLNFSENRNKRRRQKKKMRKALKAADNINVGLQEVASETKTLAYKIEVPVDVSIKPVSEKDSCVEPTADISSNSGLIEVQSNSTLNFSENKNKRKREKNKRRKALKADNTDVNLQEVASEIKTVPFRIEAPVDVSIKPVSKKAPCVEPTANISSNSGLIEVQSNSTLNFSENKNKRKRERKKRCKALKADNTEVVFETKTLPFRMEAPVNVIIKPVSEKASFVEPAANISSNSGLSEVQSYSENKNKRKREKKKKRRTALKADNTDVDLQEVASETKTDPLRIEAPVDVSIKPVSKTAPHEVEIPDDLSKKTEFVVASGEIEAAVDTGTTMVPVIKLSYSKKKRRRMRKWQNLNSLGYAADHVHPEDNSVTKNIVLEKDTSSLPSVNMCSVKQPNGHISLCLEKNEVKELNDGHNDSENNTIVTFHMASGKHYEKKDVKFAPAVAELDLMTMKEDLLVSEKQSNSAKIEATSLLEKHDVHAESVNIKKRKKKDTTYSRKKRRESSHSGENTSDCIKEDGTGRTSFDHSEEGHVTGFSENIELKRKKDASVQVLEDNMMREASIDCSDGKPVCKDNENRMNMKISKEDEENLERKSRGELKEIKITVQELPHENGVSGENSSRLKEKTSDSIPGFDTFCNHKEQLNAEVETKVEEIFPSSSHLGVTKNDVVDVTGKEDNLLQKSHPSPERAYFSHCKKKLLVLDVNGLLADIVSYASYGYKPDIKISKKAVFKRPYCDDFLRFCFERFNVGVWSSRIKKNVEKVIEFLMGDSRRKLLFIWDAYHCSNTGLNTIENRNKPLVMKELTKLWDKLEPNLPWEKGEYNETNTLLLDDSPYKALRNPAHTAIFPYSYDYKDANDSSLGPGGDLRVYLEGLAAADNVPEYVRQNPFGQRAITETNPSWGFYSKIIDTKPSQHHNNSSTS